MKSEGLIEREYSEFLNQKAFTKEEVWYASTRTNKQSHSSGNPFRIKFYKNALYPMN